MSSSVRTAAGALVVGDEVEVEFLELGSFKGEVVKVTGSTSFDVHFPCDGST